MSDGLSPTPIKCDGCESLGRRRIGHVCPDHWFFIESIVQHSARGRVHVVYACSETCRDKLWKRGPGTRSIDEIATKRMRAREDA